MEDKLSYVLNGITYDVSVKDCPEFKYGENERLSREDTDITFHQDWYDQGYTAKRFLTDDEFASLKNGLTQSVANIIKNELGIEVPEDFTLERYHDVVTNKEDHFKVVGKTRDLFAEDFNFPVKENISKFEKLLGFKLHDINPEDGKELHIIVRINRPGSTDYNPPHKDIYERWDEADYISPFINLWIPIAGVTINSTLPVAPGSHKLTEDKVLRTREGGVVEGNKYRVRMVKSWDGNNVLERAMVDYGEVLFFSGHLVHGFAVNAEPDTSRVALEFRLFKREE